MRKQQVFSLTDLRYVSIHCGRCNSDVTLDLTRDIAGQRAYFAPQRCSVCGQDFDSAVENLNLFHQLYKKLAAAAKVLTFLGEAEDKSE